MHDVRYRGRLGPLVLAAHLAVSPAIAAAPDGIADAEALSHAHALEGAWHRLETFIRNESTSLTRWTAAPPSTPWRDSWTRRGLSARYCDGILIVYAEPERLKGVGRNQRSVRLAPHLQSNDVPPPPPLHWLVGSRAFGGNGRADVVLPACMTGLPSGRVALAGEVADPFAVTMTTLDRERETRPCPAGTHGHGRVFVRDIVQEVNGRGDPLGAPTRMPWQLQSDACRGDTSTWVTYRLACAFDAGEPHNRTISGEDIYRRQKTVTAGGTSWGPPEFVSSSCWHDPEPLVPRPMIRVSTRTETRTLACIAPATGTRHQSRTLHLRSTLFPWDDGPIVQVTQRNRWRTTSYTCHTPSSEDPDDERETGIDTDGDKAADNDSIDDASDDSPSEDRDGGREMGFDTDGDGVADYDSIDDAPDDPPSEDRDGGREMGFDTDGDGVADYDSINDVPGNLMDSATPAPSPGTTEGHGGRNGGGDRGGPAGGNDGNSGGNGCGCGGPGGGGPGDVG